MRRTKKLTRAMKIALGRMGHDPDNYRLHHVDREAGCWVFIHRIKGTFLALSM